MRKYEDAREERKALDAEESTSLYGVIDAAADESAWLVCDLSKISMRTLVTRRIKRHMRAGSMEQIKIPAVY